MNTSEVTKPYLDSIGAIDYIPYYNLFKVYTTIYDFNEKDHIKFKIKNHQKNNEITGHPLYRIPKDYYDELKDADDELFINKLLELDEEIIIEFLFDIFYSIEYYRTQKIWINHTLLLILEPDNRKKLGSLKSYSIEKYLLHNISIIEHKLDITGEDKTFKEIFSGFYGKKFFEMTQSLTVSLAILVISRNQGLPTKKAKIINKITINSLCIHITKNYPHMGRYKDPTIKAHLSKFYNPPGGDISNVKEFKKANSDYRKYSKADRKVIYTILKYT